VTLTTAPSRNSRARLIDVVAEPFQRFMALEASSSILLLLMAVVALVWANSPWRDHYEALVHAHVSFGLGGAHLEMSLGHFVNDVLMVVFFFVVGMEIKRELVLGELSTRSQAMLPVLGALGGMILPAGIYASLHWGGPAVHGWGIPMATDIAFAVAALSVFGSRVPPPLKVFLLALAIADDIGAVAVIAVFYTADLSLAWLALAGLGLASTYGLNLAGVRSYVVYALVGGLVWLATYESGVHATIAGVALGFLTPSTPLDAPERETLVERGIHALENLGNLLSPDVDDHGGHRRHTTAQELAYYGRSTLSPLDFLTNVLEPWVAFFVMPVFALFNAGVTFDPSILGHPMAGRVGLAVALGLLVGKPIGVTAFSWLAVRLGLAELPRHVGWAAIAATGLLAGIGFTVALFVSALAFADPFFTAGSKIGILGGSVTATVLGILALARVLPSQAELSGNIEQRVEKIP
jgi:NhaA family Na+:H+ antiporter